jgi:Holliday junction resolvase
MRAAKVDANQAEIVEALRKRGASVQSLAAVGKGVPDLLVGYAGHTFLLEVKGANGKLTDDQKIWHAGWNGQVAIVRTVKEALRVLKL